MLNIFRLNIIFLVGLVCVAQIRSDWLLTQPCFNNDSVIPGGTYSPGSCMGYEGRSSYGQCSEDGGKWMEFSCDGYDCSNNCVAGYETLMNQCTNGYFYTCTTANRPDFTKGFGSDAISLELFNDNDCTYGPYDIYAAKKDSCINYSPQNTWYNSFSVSCTAAGTEAKLSLFLQRNCQVVSKTYIVTAGNCTSDPDILDGTPVIARCS